MLVRELSNILTGMEPDSEALVVLYTLEGRQKTFEIIDVTPSEGSTQIEISEDSD